MKRFFKVAVLLSAFTINAQPIMPTDSFKQDKETLYQMRIRMAHFLTMLKNHNMEAPAVLNQLSSIGQELINTMIKIEKDDMEGVMYSLNHIMEDVPVFKKAEKAVKMLPGMNTDIQEGISNVETIAQKILSLMPVDLSSQ